MATTKWTNAMNEGRHTYGLLKISGIEAKKFLQGQLTCNVDRLNVDETMLGAHCNPKGRVISFFNLFMLNNDYYQLMTSSMLPIAIAALKKYAIFYKVSLDILPFNPNIIIPKNFFRNADEFTYNCIQTGIPILYPETSSQFLPHDLNLDKLNAISFDKGCYTGQEIIARMHYRGTLKKHLYRATISSAIPIKPGDEVKSLGQTEMRVSGVIVDCISEKIRDPNKHENLLLLVCDETDAKNEHLFFAQDHHAYITFLV